MPSIAIIAPPCTRTGACPLPLTLNLPPSRPRDGVSGIGGTDAQVLHTLHMMRAIVEDAAAPSPTLPPDVASVLRPARPRSGPGSWDDITAIEYAYRVGQMMHFQADPPDAEALIHPHRLLMGDPASMRGDCDDRAMLMCALLRANGYPPDRCGFVVMSRDREGDFEHVFSWGKPATRPTMPMDPQEKTPLGRWTPPLPQGGRAWLMDLTGNVRSLDSVI